MIRGKFLRSGDELSELLSIRRELFSLAEGAERDALDQMAEYALVYDESDCPMGAGRLSLDGDDFVLSFVGVREMARGRGLGDLVMRMLLYRVQEMALPKLKLESPLSVVPFFARYGFKPVGEPDGDARQKMEVALEGIDIEGSCHKCPHSAEKA